MTNQEKKSRLHEMLPVFICALSIPISMFMWLGNLAYTKFVQHPEHDDVSTLTPTRLLFSTIVPLMLMTYGLRRGGVNKSGACFGLLIAIILSLASHAFLASLAMFYFTSSKATKFRGKEKAKFEDDFKGAEGKRNWAQVLCNAGMPAQLALLYLLDCGSGEHPIDFSGRYRSSWLGVGIMSAFACCNGDTWASELGTVLAKGDPFLITSRKRVPRGTNGGVTVIGLIVSALGGIAVGLAYFLTVRYTVDGNILALSPPQWPVILYGGIAGLFGSIVDSVLGATVQYSGVDEKGRIVEYPGQNIRHISGFRLFDNHSVNLISSILTGVVMPCIALAFWPGRA